MRGKPKEKRRSWKVTCSCGRSYIYNRDERCGHTMTKCNSCMANERRREKKIRAVEYKGGKCMECGYDRSVAALIFHHRDPDHKQFTFSGSHCRSWEALKRELDKCDMVCLNCHAEIHHPDP